MPEDHSQYRGDRPLEELESNLNYQFGDRELLCRALTHRSYANEQSDVTDDNQRLEFLGDAVLGLVIADALFADDREAPEGILSRRLSQLVCEEALVERANDIELGDFLMLGRGEELTGGRTKAALLADAYEAVLGAVYLDAGHDPVRDLILEHFEEAITQVTTPEADGTADPGSDHKSRLQREVQSRRPIRPDYRIAETTGPPHDRSFVAEVLVDGTVVGRGEGRSKQRAEQAAAAEAIDELNRENSRLRRVLDEPAPNTTEK